MTPLPAMPHRPWLYVAGVLLIVLLMVFGKNVLGLTDDVGLRFVLLPVLIALFAGAIFLMRLSRRDD